MSRIPKTAEDLQYSQCRIRIMHCNEISINVFPEKELHGLSPISTFMRFIYYHDQSTYFPAAE